MRYPFKTMHATLILVGMSLLVPTWGQAKQHPRSAHLTTSPKSAVLTGTYIRIKHRKAENQSAELTVKQISAHRIKVNLTALWWTVAGRSSPHNGEIEATITLNHHVAVYVNGNYRLTMQFHKHTVVLTESGSNLDFGMNVRAAGTYRRARRSRAQGSHH